MADAVSLATGGFSKLLGPVGMGLGAAGQIFGMIKGAKEKKKQQGLLDKQHAENKAMYDKNASQSFLDTSVAKSQVTAAKNDLVDERKEVAGRGAITGASDETQVAANSNVTKNYNQRLSQLAGMGTQYQQNQEGMYRHTKAGLDAQQQGINQQAADSAGNLVENAAGLMGTAAMGIGGAKKKPKLGNGNAEEVTF